MLSRKIRGELYGICFGGENSELEAYSFEGFDEFIVPLELLEGGVVIGTMGLDAWIATVNGNVWRVHPEDASDLGPAVDFMTEQVRFAIS
jgi:hypothetical protein